MELRIEGASATDCSRLAWLYLRLQQKEKARAFVNRGLAREPLNDYCQKLKEKLIKVSESTPREDNPD